MVDNRSGATGQSKKGSQRSEGSSYGRGQDLQGRSPQSETFRSGQREHVEIEYRNVGRGVRFDAHQAAPAAVGAGVGFLLGWLFAGQTSRRTDTGGRAGRSQQRSRGSWLGSETSVEADETADLIASSKVEGTAVYGRDGEKLGEVYNFMVGKRSGRVAYAVMTFGGVLGIGGSYYPLPWNQLTYDTNLGGYVVDLDKDRIGGAPSYRSDEDAFADPQFGRRVDDYWSVGA